MQEPKKAVLTYIFIFLFLLLLLFEGEALTDSLYDALVLCLNSLIPSLFPYLVLSELVVTSGLGDRLGKAFQKPFGRLFGVSGAGVSAIVLGAVCGFPVGARCAVMLYDKGVLSKKETERLLCFCNNTGAGFLVAGVGASFFGNANFGLVLYAVQIISALIIGMGLSKLFKLKCGVGTATPKAPALGASLFTNAIGSASKNMLFVCGYIVFFSSLTGGLSGVISRITDSPLPRVLISGILEISSGCHSAAELFGSGAPFLLCAALAAFFVGWSGLSVHAQTAAICKDLDISLSPYIASKLFQGLICAALAVVYYKVFPESSVSAFAPIEHQVPQLAKIFGSAVNLLFIFALLKKLIKNCSKMKKFVI